VAGVSGLDMNSWRLGFDMRYWILWTNLMFWDKGVMYRCDTSPNKRSGLYRLISVWKFLGSIYFRTTRFDMRQGRDVEVLMLSEMECHLILNEVSGRFMLGPGSFGQCLRPVQNVSVLCVCLT